ncbi:hypothetical protein ABKN59_004875 [Abortiporus biennis]
MKNSSPKHGGNAPNSACNLSHGVSSAETSSQSQDSLVVEEVNSNGRPRSTSRNFLSTLTRKKKGKNEKFQVQYVPSLSSVTETHAGTNQKGSDSWTIMETRMKAQDEKMIKDWNDEIDTLMVFAGLFSALIHPVVSSVVSIFIGVWLFAYFATTFLPIFSIKCPYKSPQARLMFNLYLILSGKRPWKKRSPYPHLVWARNETQDVISESLEVDAIATADAAFSDDDVLNTMVGYRLHDLQIPLTFTGPTVAKISNLSDKAMSIMVSILLDALGRDEVSALISVDLRWVQEALSFVKNAILVSKKRLITSDVNGSLVDIDAYLSRSLHKVLGMGRAVPISEALQILSLRAIHTEVRLPRNVLQVMPMILISAKHLLNMRRSKDTLNVNPFSVICMVLCMLEKLPLEWINNCNLLRLY